MQTAHYMVLFAVSSTLMIFRASADPAPALAPDAAPVFAPSAGNDNVLIVPRLSAPPVLPSIPADIISPEDVSTANLQAEESIEPEPEKNSPEDLEMLSKQKELLDENRDWLMKGYEAQLQIHAAANSSQTKSTDQSTDLYRELSSNKELARLAGLPYVDPAGSGSTSAPGAPTKKRLETDSSDDSSLSDAAVSKFTYVPFFKPFAPLGGSNTSGTTSFISLAPIASFLPGFSNDASSAATTPVPKRPYVDTTALQTPGMIASQGDGLPGSLAPDDSLDVLPGETIKQAEARRDDNNSIKLDELPEPMSAIQLHKTQSMLLSVPGSDIVKSNSGNLPALPSAPSATDNPNAPIPVRKLIQISPIRPPLPNPYDILGR